MKKSALLLRHFNFIRWVKMISRIKKRKQFNWIFKNGDNVNSKLLTLVFCKSKIKGSLVGYSVSKKIGKAVTRNKVKRRLKEIVKINQSLLQNKYSYILVAKPGIENATFIELTQEVENILVKAKINKNAK